MKKKSLRTLMGIALFLPSISLFLSCSKEEGMGVYPPGTDGKPSVIKDIVIDGFTYSFIDEEAVVEKFPDIPEVIVPASVTYKGKEYTVTTIGNEVCTLNVKTLSLPETIKLSRPYAFKNNGLEKVFIPDLKFWCNIQFEDNSEDNFYKEHIYYSNPVRENTGFYIGNEEVTDELTIPDGITVISAITFPCLRIKKLKIGNDVEIIGGNAFRKCIELENIKFGNNLKTIGWMAFAGCDKIKTLILPESLERIEYWAFPLSLETVYLPESIKEIQPSAFRNVKNVHIASLYSWCMLDLKREVLGGVVEFFNYDLYLNDEILNHVVIPETIKEIKEYSFSGSRIESVEFPKDLRKISKGAFNCCYGIKEVTLPGGITSMSLPFVDCINLEKVTFEEGIEEIDGFGGCPSLKTIIFPSTLKLIKDDVVYENILYNKNLESVYSFATEVPKCDFKGVLQENAILYVPEESIEKYKEDSVWGLFKTIAPLP